MNFKLIADSGSTKTDWILVDIESLKKQEFNTAGINAMLASDEEIISIFREVRDTLIGGNSSIVPVIKEIHFYGSGCATPAVCSRVENHFRSVWPGVENICVNSDLLGAARALFGAETGIACILGTGSNSCLYSDHQIVENIPSLGYILGDEGSGAALGKRLLSDACKGQLPSLITDRLFSEYNLSLEVVLNRLYRSPAPNRFLASLVPFIKKNLWNPYIYAIVLKEFKKFLRRNVGMYEGARSLPIGFIGSIAVEFEDILKEAATGMGLEITGIIRRPADRVADYHTKFTINDTNLKIKSTI